MKQIKFIQDGNYVDANGKVLGEAQEAGQDAPTRHIPDVQPSSAAALPDDFPVRDNLTGAGIDSLEKVRAASDEQLLAITGIGQATLVAIRSAQGK